VPNQALRIGLLAVLLVLIILVLTTDGEDTFTVVVALEEEQEADLGEEGPSVGDLYAFSGPLLDESENTELGRFDGECTTTSSPGPSAEARRLCNVTATFVEEREGAEIEAQGVGRIEAEDVVFAVTGGTGEFRDARGQATFEYEEREDGIVITYEIMRKVAAGMPGGF
jgi:Dirigent-like protein